MTAAEAVAQLCARKMTALQYAEAVLEVAETYSCLNAFSFLDKDKVIISHYHCLSLLQLWYSRGIAWPLLLHIDADTSAAIYIAVDTCWPVRRCWQKPRQWTSCMRLGMTSSRSVAWRLR